MDLQETKDGLAMLCTKWTWRLGSLGKDWLLASLLATCFVTGLAANATGQLPGTQLRSLFPPGGQLGTTVDVRIVGADQDDVHRLQFSHPGISAKQVMTPGDDLEPPKPAEGRFRVAIDRAVPPGVYEARAFGRFGASNPRSFTVGVFDELVDKGGNNDRTKAISVSPNTTVNGIVDNENRDYFKLSLRAGQRIMIDCAAERIDSRLNGSLVLFNAQGKEIGRSHDYRGADPFLDVTAPADGDYILTLFDFPFRGGTDYFYRLTVHSTPHVDFVFPPSGTIGATERFTLYGRNLPGGQPAGCSIGGIELEKSSIELSIPPSPEAVREHLTHAMLLPAGSMLDCITHRISQMAEATIYAAREPVVIEQEPNDTPASAQPVSLPVEVVGQFLPARDVDHVRFEAAKGDILYLEVFAHRLGQDVDPRMLVQKVSKTSDGYEKITNVASVDDSKDRNRRIGQDYDLSTDDPTYRLVVKEKGVFQIQLWDQFGTVDDPSRIYRLVIRKPRPDFRLAAIPLPLDTPANVNTVRMGSPGIRQGGTATITVHADRQNGFDKDIEIQVEGLPAGVTTRGALIRGAATSTSLILEASETAQPWAGTLRVVGHSTSGTEKLTRVARGGAVVWGTSNRQQNPPAFRATADIGFAVLEEAAPAFVGAVEDKTWETSRGGNVEIPLKVARRRDFKGDLQLVCQELPKELKPNNITVKADAGEAKLTVSVRNSRVKPGLYSFFLRADSTSKLVRNAEAIPVAEEDQRLIEVKLKGAGDAYNEAMKIAQQSKQKLEESQKLVEDARKAREGAGEETRSVEAALVEANERFQVAQSANASAEKRLAELKAKLERTRKAKTAIDKRLAAVKKANAPNNTKFVTISAPIRLRVVDSPIVLKVGELEELRPGKKCRLPVSIERKYGFDEKVDVTAQLPKGVDGIAIAKLSLDKGVTEGHIELSAGKDAAVGSHRLTLQASAKFNKVDVKTAQQMTLQIEAEELSTP